MEAKKIVIIGAGQLGSRHLQGVLKYQNPLQIWVVDPNETSLDIAKQRAGEISHEHKVVYQASTDHIDKYIDIAIVATNSAVREKVTLNLLKNFTVKYLILEKVLFQNEQAYNNVSDALASCNTLAWVNHPRRMFNHYQEIKRTIGNHKSIQFSVVGNNWGLGCNGLHLLDICSFLSSDNNIKSIDLSALDRETTPSKRDGYIEFSGTLNVLFENGSTASITSRNSEAPGPITVFIGSEGDKWAIQEGGTNNIIHIDSQNNYKSTIKPFNPEFQSDLSTQLIDSLILNGECDLPTYKEAQSIHVPFIKELLHFFNTLHNKNDKDLKIT